jgi:hypothetical protein
MISMTHHVQALAKHFDRSYRESGRSTAAAPVQIARYATKRFSGAARLAKAMAAMPPLVTSKRKPPPSSRVKQTLHHSTRSTCRS